MGTKDAQQNAPGIDGGSDFAARLLDGLATAVVLLVDYTVTPLGDAEGSPRQLLIMMRGAVGG